MIILACGMGESHGHEGEAHPLAVIAALVAVEDHFLFRDGREDAVGEHLLCARRSWRPPTRGYK